jgi:hypothetical protein
MAGNKLLFVLLLEKGADIAALLMNKLLTPSCPR